MEAERVQRQRDPDHPMLYSDLAAYYFDMLLDLGRRSEVKRRTRDLLQEKERNPRNLGLYYLYLGRVQLAEEDLPEAEALLDRSLNHLHESHVLEFMAEAFVARATIRRHRTRFGLARDDLKQAAEIAARAGMKIMSVECHLGYAQLYLDMGQPGVARESLNAAKNGVTQTGYHRRTGELEELAARL